MPLLARSMLARRSRTGLTSRRRPAEMTIIYVTSKNIRFGYLDMSTASRIDAAQHEAIYRRCDVKKGDILLTKDGANTGNAGTQFDQ